MFITFSLNFEWRRAYYVHTKGEGVSAKTSRLNLRISDKALADIKRAAELCQQDVTSFVLDAALEKVRRLFPEEHKILVPIAEYQRLLESLDEPVETSAGVQELYKRVQELEDSGKLVDLWAKPVAGA